jgi:hypothetical protein
VDLVANLGALRFVLVATCHATLPELHLRPFLLAEGGEVGTATVAGREFFVLDHRSREGAVARVEYWATELSPEAAPAGLLLLADARPGREDALDLAAFLDACSTRTPA